MQRIWNVLCLAGLVAVLGPGCYHDTSDRSPVPQAQTSSQSGGTTAPADTQPPAPKSEEKQPAAETGAVKIQYRDWEGLQQLIASHQGKVVVVDYWSTFCGPCMKEFPHLVELSHKYADAVACISVSLDYEGEGDPREAEPGVRKFLEKQKATFDNVIFSQDPIEHLLPKLGAAAIPVVQVYDQQGKLVQTFTHDGGKTFTYRDVEAVVEQLLGKKEG